MKNTVTGRCLSTALILFIPALLYACAHTRSIAARHPDVGAANPEFCTQCHVDWRANLSHTAGFGTRHKFYAYQQQGTCGLCHAEGFCSDCHAHREELKPSDKYKEYVTRDLPHRGDYLAQHQIDGRINPAPCVKCHARQNNERCGRCHRR